jgi:hypothetical protein
MVSCTRTMSGFRSYNFVGNPDGEFVHDVVVVCHFVVAFTTLCSVVVGRVRVLKRNSDGCESVFLVSVPTVFFVGISIVRYITLGGNDIYIIKCHFGGSVNARATTFLIRAIVFIATVLSRCRLS